MGKLKTMAREPSSWAGLAAIVQGVSMLLPAWKPVLDGLSMLLGAVAIAQREGGANGKQ